MVFADTNDPWEYIKVWGNTVPETSNRMQGVGDFLGFLPVPFFVFCSADKGARAVAVLEKA